MFKSTAYIYAPLASTANVCFRLLIWQHEVLGGVKNRYLVSISVISDSLQTNTDSLVSRFGFTPLP